MAIKLLDLDNDDKVADAMLITLDEGPKPTAEAERCNIRIIPLEK